MDRWWQMKSLRDIMTIICENRSVSISGGALDRAWCDCGYVARLRCRLAGALQLREAYSRNASTCLPAFPARRIVPSLFSAIFQTLEPFFRGC